jgi:hypothetical protein
MVLFNFIPLTNLRIYLAGDIFYGFVRNKRLLTLFLKWPMPSFYTTNLQFFFNPLICGEGFG